MDLDEKIDRIYSYTTTALTLTSADCSYLGKWEWDLSVSGKYYDDMAFVNHGAQSRGNNVARIRLSSMSNRFVNFCPQSEAALRMEFLGYLAGTAPCDIVLVRMLSVDIDLHQILIRAMRIVSLVLLWRFPRLEKGKQLSHKEI